MADHTADVPREVQVGSSGCAGCRASFRGGGWAWVLVGAWLLLRRRW